MSKVTSIKVDSDQAANQDYEISLPVKTAFLHQAIMIDGRTEATINTQKVPTLKAMGWTKNGFLRIEAKTTHLLSDASVKDSILVMPA